MKKHVKKLLAVTCAMSMTMIPAASFAATTANDCASKSNCNTAIYQCLTSGNCNLDDLKSMVNATGNQNLNDQINKMVSSGQIKFQCGTTAPAATQAGTSCQNNWKPVNNVTCNSGKTGTCTVGNTNCSQATTSKPTCPQATTPGNTWKPGTSTPDKNGGSTSNDSKNNSNNGNTEEQTNTGNSSYAQQVLTLVNKERAAAGLSALKWNDKVASVAQKKAQDMANNNYFSHTSPTYGSPFDMLKTFGVSYTAAGENIAKGQKTPESVMNGWMNSSGHKANILNTTYTDLGVGYVTDSSGNTYWVQMFIK